MANTEEQKRQHLYCTIFAIVFIFLLIISVTIGITTLVLLYKHQHTISLSGIILSTSEPGISSETNEYWTTTQNPSKRSYLENKIEKRELMHHLEQLQSIADRFDRTRQTGSSGFQATIDYIEKQLKSKTDLRVFRENVSFENPFQNIPSLSSIINGHEMEHIYRVDFHRNVFSGRINYTRPIRLTLIRNFGCNQTDWETATPYPVGKSMALLMHDPSCSMEQKLYFAEVYKTSGLLLFESSKNLSALPMIFPPKNATIPMLTVSANLAFKWIEALLEYQKTRPMVRIFIPLATSFPDIIRTENICAETRNGAENQTILVASHSDSVPNGPGINDNGSGTIATLVLALKLFQVLQETTHLKHYYRIRFCWWGAEEYGLQGSFHHVDFAKRTTISENRLENYLLMLNFDMLASPNYYFGIFEPSSLPDSITDRVKAASMKISQLFQDWFITNHLPWDNSSLAIQSDHWSFLEAGIACGGIFSGADSIKSAEQRHRYNKLLGEGRGGIAGVSFDPCYHKFCDTIDNIDLFAFEIMTKSAASILENLSQIPDLKFWLYESVMY